MGQRQNHKRIETYFELNKNESTTYKNLWDTAKTKLQDKRIAMNAYIRGEKAPIQ